MQDRDPQFKNQIITSLTIIIIIIISFWVLMRIVIKSLILHRPVTWVIAGDNSKHIVQVGKMLRYMAVVI